MGFSTGRRHSLKNSSLPLFAALSLSALPLAAHAEGKAIIILDGLGSMWGRINDRPKIEIAGIELVVPPRPGNASAIAQAVGQMRFRGKAPLSEAVHHAAAESRHTEEKATMTVFTR